MRICYQVAGKQFFLEYAVVLLLLLFISNYKKWHKSCLQKARCRCFCGAISQEHFEKCSVAELKQESATWRMSDI